MKTILRKAQAFSMDLIIATVLFIATFAAFYGFITFLLVEPEDKAIAREGQSVATAIATEGNTVQVIEAQQINEDKLKRLADKDYEEIKSELGVQHDFCMYIEDENGNLVLLNINRKTSIGKDNAKLTFPDGREVECGKSS